ncbi:MAG: DNA-directed RNA polymerase subunit alpha [Candidatus Sungbacteria bacterium]|uniref:DNA-directed RNA polymerase subunit alpha n=1 Tax=Candidatus Sungiibacteriota bacterium TaxID=2750080 RepID=A0A9D6QSE7_9BACT|nr:DNA-directed RNA polymerase subunit alpha [Candidatus Sungbacteria bacterium]
MIPSPSEARVIQEEGNRGTYEIENLYPGYGLTIGNSLRRVMLSSLEGAAVTSVKIKGVGHEFTSIDGVLEDIVEIILNLKRLRFKIHGDGPYAASLSVKGEKEVKAKDLKCPSQLEIVSPDLHIATITDKKATLEMELEVSRGLGYQPVEQRSKDKVEIGTIALDAAFSPVRHVNYEVENMRVGDQTDYNRLRLHIETDGSLTPQEALAGATSILVDQFKSLLANYETRPEMGSRAHTAESIAETAEDGTQDLAKLKIVDMDFSSRTLNALAEAGIKTAGALAKKTEEKLREFEGIGDKGIEEIRAMLAKLGLSLKS